MQMGQFLKNFCELHLLTFNKSYQKFSGQFIDHDITHAPMFPISDCCTSEGRNDRVQCYPLVINNITDPVWRGKGDCMSFKRSLRSSDLKCSLDSNIQQVSGLPILFDKRNDDHISKTHSNSNYGYYFLINNQNSIDESNHSLVGCFKCIFFK